MEKLLVLLAAIGLVVLGARGTYKAVWNSFFPNEQIVTNPVNTQAINALNTVPGSNVPSGASQQQNQSPSGYATNPQEVGQQAAKATQKFVSGVINGSGGSNSAHTVPAQGGSYPVQSIGRTQEQVINTGIPSWWPSWLPWPGTLIGYYPGEGQTNQSVPNPFAP